MIRLYLVLISLAFLITLTPLNTDPASDYAPVWSPDGSHIAFLRAEVENGPTEIRQLTLAGMQQTKLPSAAGASDPVWSPNGSHIAYVENGAQTHRIHIMNPDGSQDQPIVERSGSIGAPAWSPDGRKIAATSSGELFVVTLENGEVDRLVDERVTGVPPLWSHDGNRLLYVEQVNSSAARAIVRVDTDGDNAQTLIERPAIAAISGSPNGSRIAFVYREGDQQELAVMQADGSGFTRLTPGRSVEAYSAWSPDGATLAYVHNDDIYLIAPDGSQETRYTDYSGREILPTWTPDGKWIAFVSDGGPGQRKALYLYSTEGQQYFELDNAMTAASVSWSPDSTRVIVGSYQLLTSSALYTIRADGSAVTKIASKPAEDKFTWSPDGQRIAFVNGDLFVAKNDGTNLRKLTTSGAIASYQWSPDSRKLAFLSDGLYVISVDGAGLLQVAGGVAIHSFAWSPLGDRIAIAGIELYLVDSDGGNFQQVTTFGSVPSYNPDPAWSPDGRQIAFSTGRLYLVDADGSNLRQLTESIDNGPPIWSPDGSMIAYMNYMMLYVMSADGRESRRLSFDNADMPGPTLPYWSPDSRRIVFSDCFMYPAADGDAADAPSYDAPSAGGCQQFLINADGSGQIAIGGDPLWSSDGRVMVMDLGKAIYISNGDGSEPYLLNRGGYDAYSPSFAPDGHRFVFVHASSPNSNLYIATIH